MEPWQERIVCDPDILVGKPTIKGTRISVELILGWLGADWSIEEILADYPQLSREDVLAAVSFAAEFMRSERFMVTAPQEPATP